MNYRMIGAAVLAGCLFLSCHVAVGQQSQDLSREVDRMLDLALVLLQAGRPAEGCAKYAEAERMARVLRYSRGLAEALHGLGYCARLMRDIETAAAYLVEAGQLYRRIRDYPGYARVTGELAVCYQELGLLELAVTSGLEALAVFRDVVGIEGYEREAGMLHNNLGRIYLEFLSKLDLALGHYSAAYDLFLSIDHNEGVGNTLIGLGGIRERFGQYSEAIAHYRQALTRYQQIPDVRKIADTYSRIGGCHVELREHSAAASAFEKAIDEFGRLQSSLRCTTLLLYPFMNPSGAQLCLASKEGECIALQGLCQAAIGMGDLEAAEGLARLALSYAEGLQMLYGTLFPGEMRSYVRPRLLMAWSLYQLGECRFAARDFGAALSRYREATEIGGWGTLFLIGEARSLDALGESDRAYAVYKAALEIAEGARAETTALETFRMAYQRQAEEYYQEILDLAARIDRPTREILLLAERARARSLLDALGYGGQESFGKVEGLLLDGTVDLAQINELLAKASSHLESHEAVLVYALGKSHLFIWVVTRAEGISDALVQRVDYDDLLLEVYELRSSIEATPVSLVGPWDRLERLYEVLVRPVRHRFEDKSVLIVVPSGPLWYVPFGALAMTDEEEIREGGADRYPYLVEHYAVAYAPSLASLPVLLGDSGVQPNGVLLALANPTPRGAWGPVPRMEKVAWALAEALGDDSDVHTGERATEAALKQRLGEAGPYRFVFFGCHGWFNPGSPLYSILALGEAGEEDGDLYAREVLGLPLQGTDLAVLLGCETLLPAVESRGGQPTMGLPPGLQEQERLSVLRTLVRGDEIVGLTRAFLVAGAKAVLATHWEISERVAALLAEDLGTCLRDGGAKGLALQTAQRSLIRRGYSDPWLWAGFMLVGNWR